MVASATVYEMILFYFLVYIEHTCYNVGMR